MSGLFFIGIALFQILWAGVVLRVPRIEVMSVGIAANLASMALWGVSRLWGIPFGPNAGVPEPIGPPGVLATLLEALVVASVVWSLLPRERTAVLATGSYRFALGGSAAIVLLFAAPGVITGLEQSHDHGSTGHDSSQHESGPSAPSESDHVPTQLPKEQRKTTTPAPEPEGHSHE
jgi:hypothetical protein